MRELVGIISNNKIQNGGTGFLSKYLNQEDISSLNNPEILEDVLKNVENSVIFESHYAKNILNILIWVFSVILSNLTGLFERLLKYLGKFSGLASNLFFVRKYLLKLRLLTVMPVFFLTLSLFSPQNTIVKEKVTNISSCLETAQVFSVPHENKSIDIYSSSTFAKGSIDNLNNSITASKKRNEEINKTVTGYKSKNTKENINVKNPSAVKSSPLPSKAPDKKSARSSSESNANNKSVAARENNISRSAEDRIELSDVIKNCKNKLTLRATAYDLSIRSCKKPPSHPAYGITKTGTRATVGRTIAVDPLVIPLRSKVYISFPEPYKNLNGIYYAEDTGSLIKGNKIDIFFGEDKPGDKTIYNLARKFGVQNVEVYIL